MLLLNGLLVSSLYHHLVTQPGRNDVNPIGAQFADDLHPEEDDGGGGLDWTHPQCNRPFVWGGSRQLRHGVLESAEMQTGRGQGSRERHDWYVLLILVHRRHHPVEHYATSLNDAIVGRGRSCLTGWCPGDGKCELGR